MCHVISFPKLFRKFFNFTFININENCSLLNEHLLGLNKNILAAIENKNRKSGEGFNYTFLNNKLWHRYFS